MAAALDVACNNDGLAERRHGACTLPVRARTTFSLEPAFHCTAQDLLGRAMARPGTARPGTARHQPPY